MKEPLRVAAPHARLIRVGRVGVQKRKYPAAGGGVISVDPVLDEPGGRWLFAPAGDGNPHSLDGLLFLPCDGWFVAWWWADADPLCTVDVVIPARLVDGVWVYDDLEIDLAVRASDGVVHVVDVDEFADAVARVPYPGAVIEGAINGMRWAERAMSTRVPPFDVGFGRLAECARDARARR